MLKGRVVPFNLQAGLTSGTISLSAPGLGTPQGAVIFLSGAESDQITTPRVDIRVCVGFCDATQQGSSGVISFGDLPTTAGGRFNDQLGPAVEINSSAVLGRLEFDSIAVDTLTLRYTAAAFTGNWRGYAVLITGAPDFECFEWQSFSSAPTDIVLSGAFKPDVVIMSSNENNTWDVNNSNKFGWGIATRGAADSINMCGWGAENPRNRSSVRVRGRAENFIIPGAANDRSTYISAWNPDGFELSVTDTGQHYGYGIAFTLPPEQEALLSDQLTAVAAGDFNIPTPYSAGSPDTELFFLCHTRMTGKGYVSDNANANCYSYGAADSSGNQAMLQAVDTQGSADSKSKSFFSSNHIALIHNDGTLLTQEKVAAVKSMTGGNVTVDYTTADGTGRWAFWLAIQAGAAAPSDDVEVALPTAASLLDAYDPATRTTEHVGSTPLVESLPLTVHPPGVLAQENARSTNPGSSSSLVARPPATVVMDATRVTAPAAASIARGRAPLIEVESDVKIGLPSLSLALRGYTPEVDAGTDANVQLPSGSLPLGAYVGTISIPENVETGLLTTNLDLKVYAPVARTTEHVGSYLVTASSAVVASPPAIVVEGEIGVGLPTASSAVNATAPQVSSGNVVNSMLLAARVGLTAYPPGTFVEFDVQTALPTAHSLGAVYGPGTYLAGDKASTPSSARLRLMTAPPRVAIGDPATMAPKDGGALGPVLAEVVVPTMNQKVVP